MLTDGVLELGDEEFQTGSVAQVAEAVFGVAAGGNPVFTGGLRASAEQSSGEW